MHVGTFLNPPSALNEEHSQIIRNLKNLDQLRMSSKHMRSAPACKLGNLILRTKSTLRTLEISFDPPSTLPVRTTPEKHSELIRNILFHGLGNSISSYALPHLTHLTLYNVACEFLDPLRARLFDLCSLKSLRLQNCTGIPSFLHAFHRGVVKNDSIVKLKLFECHYSRISSKASAENLEDFV